MGYQPGSSSNSSIYVTPLLINQCEKGWSSPEFGNKLQLTRYKLYNLLLPSHVCINAPRWCTGKLCFLVDSLQPPFKNAVPIKTSIEFRDFPSIKPAKSPCVIGKTHLTTIFHRISQPSLPSRPPACPAYGPCDCGGSHRPARAAATLGQSVLVELLWENLKWPSQTQPNRYLMICDWEIVYFTEQSDITVTVCIQHIYI